MDFKVALTFGSGEPFIVENVEEINITEEVIAFHGNKAKCEVEGFGFVARNNNPICFRRVDVISVEAD